MKTRNSVTLYRKLRNFLGVSKMWYRATNPDIPTNKRGIVKNGRWWEIRWLPIVKETTYRRLTYEEFCETYNLEMISI